MQDASNEVPLTQEERERVTIHIHTLSRTKKDHTMFLKHSLTCSSLFSLSLLLPLYSALLCSWSHSTLDSPQATRETSGLHEHPSAAATAATTTTAATTAAATESHTVAAVVLLQCRPKPYQPKGATRGTFKGDDHPAKGSVTTSCLIISGGPRYLIRVRCCLKANFVR